MNLVRAVRVTWLGALAAESCDNAHGVGEALDHLLAEGARPRPTL